MEKSTTKTVKLATAVATVFSICSLLVCFIGVPIICSEIRAVFFELDTEMASFKAASSDLWKDLIKISPARRHKRQFLSPGYGGSSATEVPISNPDPDVAVINNACQCKPNNNCPAGPPGPPGAGGGDGDHGIAGDDGVDGKDYKSEEEGGYDDASASVVQSEGYETSATGYSTKETKNEYGIRRRVARSAG
uniref:Nematode cuticle collagen N-terminal domain-containing protein n=1 Tax=Plectus sambesii TaxID=2011161 RepID=A0A914VVV1_9BILA